MSDSLFYLSLDKISKARVQSGEAKLFHISLQYMRQKFEKKIVNCFFLYIKENELCSLKALISWYMSKSPIDTDHAAVATDGRAEE